MFGMRPKKKDEIIKNRLNELNINPESGKISASLESNKTLIQKLFENDDTLVTRYFENTHDKRLRFLIAYSNGSVDATIINENIIKPGMLNTIAYSGEGMADEISNHVLLINEVTKTEETAKIIDSVAYGDTVMFIEGCSEALLLNTKNFQMRAIDEPSSERILSGPREGFTESLVTNLSLIRRKLRTNRLKMKYRSFGRQSNTTAAICYIEGIADEKILTELYSRLDKVDIDAVLDTNYLTELIRDDPRSPFRSTGYTERPDVVLGKLLEGRIAVFLDGTPVVMTLPYLFVENFQSNEDYYLSFYYTSFSRLLRILGFILTIAIPALYIAVVAFHHEMLPTPLLISIAIERQSVPLPAALEAFIMLVVFDILRETGIRMPSNVGEALSIVGALVIGQAAVNAKLVAAPMIIVVAITGITNLLVPKMNATIIYIRLFLLTLASALGLFGLIIGMALLLIHVLNLKSFGLFQVQLPSNPTYQDFKDSLIRSPQWVMKTRPRNMSENKTRFIGQRDENDV